MTLPEYCIEQQKTQLLEEWDTEKNTDIRPEQLSSFSHAEIWWRCAKGHFWKCKVKDRTQRGSGCPYCAGKLPVRGENDLATLKPELVKEWNTEKNGGLKPEDFTTGSEQKVWWKCELGHEWQAAIENRALKENKCPFCTGKRAWPGFNDLETLFPELMKEWHPTYNKDLDPSRLRPASAKRVTWICGEGHVWETFLYARTNAKRHGCPYCAGNARKRRAGQSKTG